MKKLFGDMGRLGKSMSMKELPSQEYRKKGFKHWGEKVKECVENLVCNYDFCCCCPDR
jgi:hypothetical protein